MILTQPSRGLWKPNAEDKGAVSTVALQRKKQWLPRTDADFGGGGSFPEIHVAQYPLGMGKKASTGSRVVALQTDEKGRVEWDAVVKQNTDKLVIYSKPTDQLPAHSSSDALQRPDAELDASNIARTKQALEETLNSKLAIGVVQKQQNKEPQYIKYTPNQQAPGHNAACSQRVVRMVEKQMDPLEPPKFKHKRVPRGPPSPPPPLQHSPPRKLTAKDQAEWKIPPCVSNWKNQKGYTIPLDKRLQADGRHLQDLTVNDKFAALSEDLYIAERKAREEIKMRNEMVKQKKARDEEARELQLRELAARARAERANAHAAERETEDPRERDRRQEIINERKRDIERDVHLEHAGKKSKRDREGDRDISERIALGQAQPTSQETMYDARLFNQSSGMDSGFGDGEGDKYDVYDRPLFADRSKAIGYRHEKERMEQNMGSLASVPSGEQNERGRGFSGTEKSKGARSAPVEFEKDTSDPFGLDNLLSEAKGR